MKRKELYEKALNIQSEVNRMFDCPMHVMEFDDVCKIKEGVDSLITNMQTLRDWRD